jgi:GDPmannose 4,6-dehydratase
MYACNGILFNHESPRRGETFVTRKITRAAVRIAAGQQKKVFLGKLDARRDWGHAKDYVRGMWLMLQQDEPEDYVLATGKTTSVRQLCEMAFREAGIEIEWKGEGVDEVGINKETGKEIIAIDPQYFRPAEVEELVGDAQKAKEKLGWKPQHLVQDIVKEMVEEDFKEVRKKN